MRNLILLAAGLIGIAAWGIIDDRIVRAECTCNGGTARSVGDALGHDIAGRFGFGDTYDAGKYPNDMDPNQLTHTTLSESATPFLHEGGPIRDGAGSGGLGSSGPDAGNGGQAANAGF
jgi:hypothetical protein